MNLREKCEAFVRDVADMSNLEADELNIVRINVLNMINDLFNERVNAGSDTVAIDYIASNMAIVEVIDHETALCFRRELPLRYEETGNGVSLIGEDISGMDTQISFLSDAAYEKIKEMTGKGPDVPRCK